jgi:hypothetical protein
MHILKTRWKYSYFFFLLFLLTGCKSEVEFFNETALNFAKDDNRIDEQEYRKLVNEISESDNKTFKQFKDEKGEIENLKVKSYLVKYFNAKKLSIKIDEFLQSESLVPKKLYNVNVFLENSASMDGYVKGVTEFETAIYNLLGDFKISGICDSLNLNYINKSIPYQKKNALPDDIQDFVEKLEPSVFKQRGGDRTVSDLKNILSTVLNSVNDKNISILISDFVFSPGKNQDAQNYLNNQEIGIKIDFSNKLRNFDLAAILIQMKSNFNGDYYTKNNIPIKFNGKRPYYIWLFGNTQQISTLFERKILDNLKGGYLNRQVMFPIKRIEEAPYKIQYSPKIGSYSAKELNDKIISDAKPSSNNKNKGLFGFNVAVDFSKTLQDEDYFLDSTNYLLSNKNYQLRIEKITDRSNPSISGYTHLLKLQTNQLREEIIQIDVLGKMPSWILTSTSGEDSNFLKDTSQHSKTFGLKYLIEGANDAFYPISKPNVLNSFRIVIKK